MSTLLFLVAITMIWFLPGIVLRTWQEGKMQAREDLKKEDRAKAIARLYPKKMDE